jgi:hypothetical protein
MNNWMNSQASMPQGNTYGILPGDRRVGQELASGHLLERRLKGERSDDANAKLSAESVVAYAAFKKEWCTNGLAFSGFYMCMSCCGCTQS